jgi:hypothetical protein
MEPLGKYSACKWNILFGVLQRYLHFFYMFR